MLQGVKCLIMSAVSVSLHAAYMTAALMKSDKSLLFLLVLIFLPHSIVSKLMGVDFSVVVPQVVTIV